MSWDYQIEDSARRDLHQLAPSAAMEIRRFLDTRVRGARDPRAFGKPLRGFWRYRVRDWRILCRLVDSRLVVMVIQVAHRSTAYDG